MYRPKKVLHIEFPEGWRAFDARPVFTEINLARSHGCKIAFSPAIETELGEISLHLATRAGILQRCVELNNELLEKTILAVMANERELLRLDFATLYLLLLSVDSFLYECLAYEELLRKFSLRVMRGVLGWKGSLAAIKYNDLVNQAGIVDGVPWKHLLETRRNRFAHGATPWVAVDVSRMDERVFDFLIMSENIKDFDGADPDSYFLVVRDFNLLIQAIQVHGEAVQEFLTQNISRLS